MIKNKEVIVDLKLQDVIDPLIDKLEIEDSILMNLKNISKDSDYVEDLITFFKEWDKNLSQFIFKLSTLVVDHRYQMKDSKLNKELADILFSVKHDYELKITEDISFIYSNEEKFFKLMRIIIKTENGFIVVNKDGANEELRFKLQNENESLSFLMKSRQAKLSVVKKGLTEEYFVLFNDKILNYKKEELRDFVNNEALGFSKYPDFCFNLDKSVEYELYKLNLSKDFFITLIVSINYEEEFYMRNIFPKTRSSYYDVNKKSKSRDLVYLIKEDKKRKKHKKKAKDILSFFGIKEYLEKRNKESPVCLIPESEIIKIKGLEQEIIEYYDLNYGR
tara:strand:- start:1660 stop:2661 length:1002 start_codon:yes stop_codon:yes gene_type:complete